MAPGRCRISRWRIRSRCMDYDFHFSFGQGTHGGAQGNAELPESLTWLWRDYDPAKTEQVYEMEPAEKAKPLFRVSIDNRDHYRPGDHSWPQPAPVFDQCTRPRRNRNDRSAAAG